MIRPVTSLAPAIEVGPLPTPLLDDHVHRITSHPKYLGAKHLDSSLFSMYLAIKLHEIKETCNAQPPHRPPAAIDCQRQAAAPHAVGLGAVSAFVAVNVAFGGLETLGLARPHRLRPGHRPRRLPAPRQPRPLLRRRLPRDRHLPHRRQHQPAQVPHRAQRRLRRDLPRRCRPAHPTRAGRHVRQGPRRLQPHRTRRHAGHGALARRRHPARRATPTPPLQPSQHTPDPPIAPITHDTPQRTIP